MTENGRVPLQEHFDAKIRALEIRIDERFRGSDKYNADMLAEAIKRLEQRFDLNDKALKAALLTVKESSIKVEAANDEWKQRNNEWKDTFRDLANTYLPRKEYDAAHNSLSDKVEALVRNVTAYTSARPVADKGNWRDGLSVISIIVAVAAMIGVFLHH